MIFVAAGTQDGRELTKLLLDAGHRVTASVVSHYGEQLLKRCGSERLTINDKPLNREALESYLREHRASCFVDASHPYAVNVSENAMAACRALAIPYLRYERSLTELEDTWRAAICLVHSYEEAAEEASRRGRRCGSERLTINDKPLDREALESYLREHRASCFVDASHPYAVNVSENAMAACRALAIPYLRYERSLTELEDTWRAAICLVHSYEEAAEEASRRGRVVFLTTGSRNLRQFTESPALSDCTLIARVLPTAEVIALCEGLGLSPKQIVAMQGPFSQALNREMFRQYRADVIVTKNSGAIGGTDTKIAAAVELGLPVVVIDRPVLAYDRLVHCYEDVLSFVNNLED